jgi:hypothetical protein
MNLKSWFELVVETFSLLLMIPLILFAFIILAFRDLDTRKLIFLSAIVIFLLAYLP